MTKPRMFLVLMALVLAPGSAVTQQVTVTGRITSDEGSPLPGASIVVKGTNLSTSSSATGNYSIRASAGQVLQFRAIGHRLVERTVGSETVINVQLRRVAANLEEIVVTTLGESVVKRAIGTAQQTVQGAELAQTTRENFVNALQGRVAGVEVVSSSGVPGASSMITIRGVSSISTSSQPLMILDGLPLDNKTLNTGVLASDAPGSTVAFSNRGLDFTNRASDLNPDNIESVVVLKGPEAAALYGIDAANGAIVITSKRGRGPRGFAYSNSFRVEATRARPQIQRVYGPTSLTSGQPTSFFYFGAPYAAGTQFYDNVDGFFRTALTQRHNLSFSGAEQDNRFTYRLAAGVDRQAGVVRKSNYKRVNLTAASQGQITDWLKADVMMEYAYVSNDQPWKGDGGPLIGLLVWPQTDDAREYLTAAGTRRRVTAAAAASAEVDNPYFSIEKNRSNAKNNRILANAGLVLTPVTWGSLKTNLGVDGYTNELLIMRHPESALGSNANGILDQADDVTRSLNAQTLLTINPISLAKSLSLSGLVGNQINDYKSTTTAVKGQDFLDPNFVSVNNTLLRTTRTTISHRRLFGLYGQATLDYKRYLYLTLTGRNDWTSTIPRERNSFFYPAASSSFIFSDAFPAVRRLLTGKLRAAIAEVGRDARPYAYRAVLESKTTANGGYGYGFTGPNVHLRPEFARSYELGTELGFLNDRVGLDVTWYRKTTRDAIVNDVRGSYATGYILFNLNGADIRNQGLEVTLKATPVLQRNFSWDVLANFDRTRGRTLSLPNNFPESYVSDTWLFGNVRNGTAKGMSTRSLTGLFYLRNNKGQLLISPTTGLPLRSPSFIDAGYDRQPDWTMGLTNSFRYKRLALDFLLDFRRGGDVFNATEHYLTARGLSMRTLDREQPRVIEGVLRDGKEDTDNPTKNTIVVIPAVQTDYYTTMSEELFIEKDINWVRLRDVTLRWTLPGRYLNAREASVFLTATDLFLITNYSGLDPIVNGNTAAVGGSGAAGIDYGNFPIPRGISFGLSIGF
ncbi:MAG TPA: SusC/RagA family TonB-linked outer membrane protein [Gemmatimonadales bacterium]|nr:SusC/RagA family TonB-linked outer membrane protein [Gemmatimonadales bacterium]